MGRSQNYWGTRSTCSMRVFFWTWEPWGRLRGTDSGSAQRALSWPSIKIRPKYESMKTIILVNYRPIPVFAIPPLRVPPRWAAKIIAGVEQIMMRNRAGTLQAHTILGGKSNIIPRNFYDNRCSSAAVILAPCSPWCCLLPYYSCSNKFFFHIPSTPRSSCRINIFIFSTSCAAFHLFTVND